jgi:calpain-15
VGASIFELVGDKSFAKKIKKSGYAETVAALQATGEQFTDLDFPADAKSLGKLSGVDPAKTRWLRVGQLLKAPVFVSDSIRPDDILQGSLGDCYFLSAMASLAEQDYRIKNIFASL